MTEIKSYETAKILCKQHLEAMRLDGWHYQPDGEAYRLTKAGCADRIVGIVMVEGNYAISEVKMLKPSELRGA